MELKSDVNSGIRSMGTNRVIQIFRNNFFGVLFLLIAFLIYFLIFKLGIATDISTHITMLNQYLEHGYFPIPPLYYFTLYLISYIIPVYPFILAAILVLSMSSFLKYQFVYRYLKDDVPLDKVLPLGILTFTLMFMAPIVLFFFDNHYLYLGKFSSTIWHNSTTIFVFPFCIWLFIESLNYLKKPGIYSMFKLALISVLILLAKPSFLFSFTVVFPLVCLFKFYWNKAFLYSAILSLFILICLMVEQQAIYLHNPLDQLWYKGKVSKIIVAPFEVWLLYAKRPVVNIITSFLFCITFIILKFKTFKTDYEVLYSYALLVVSLFIFLCWQNLVLDFQMPIFIGKYRYLCSF